MNHEFRQMVIETLQRGEDLPREWARELFPPEKREYELVNRPGFPGDSFR
jgi:hypothetical protein